MSSFLYEARREAKKVKDSLLGKNSQIADSSQTQFDGPWVLADGSLSYVNPYNQSTQNSYGSGPGHSYPSQPGSTCKKRPSISPRGTGRVTDTRGLFFHNDDPDSAHTGKPPSVTSGFPPASSGYSGGDGQPPVHQQQSGPYHVPVQQQQQGTFPPPGQYPTYGQYEAPAQQGQYGTAAPQDQYGAVASQGQYGVTLLQPGQSGSGYGVTSGQIPAAGYDQYAQPPGGQGYVGRQPTGPVAGYGSAQYGLNPAPVQGAPPGGYGGGGPQGGYGCRY